MTEVLVRVQKQLIFVVQYIRASRRASSVWKPFHPLFGSTLVDNFRGLPRMNFEYAKKNALLLYDPNHAISGRTELSLIFF